MASSVQKINKKYENNFEVAKKYYKTIFELNNLHVTDKEVALVAFSALHGTISTPPVREAMIKAVGTTKWSMYNMLSKLQRLGILIKDSTNKLRVNPSILPDFNQDELILVVKLDYENRATGQVN